MAKKWIGLFLASMIIWILLAGLGGEEVILGVLASIMVAMLFGRSSLYSFDLKWIVATLKFLVLYVPVFLLELIKANLDVMLRVLNPKLPINPGFVRVPTELKGDFAKLVLSNSITLTPGTITLDVDESELYVHWIDVKPSEQDVDAPAIGSPFERILRRVF